MELRHVVAATDQSEAGHHAVLAAARLAEHAGARLTVLSVRPVSPAGAAAQRAEVAAFLDWLGNAFSESADCCD